MNLITLLFSIWAAIPQPLQSACSAPAASAVEAPNSLAATLPKTGISLMQDTYVVSETYAEIGSSVKGTSKVKLVLTEDEAFILEVVGAKSTMETSYRLDIGDFNPYNTQVKLEWTDANYDTDEDDLVIWWESQNGNNGMSSGYEMERAGVLIINMSEMKMLVNLLYNKQDRSYEAAEGADENEETVHAKADDNTLWTICAYSYDVVMKEGDLFLSKYDSQKEGDGECALPAYKVGKYEYDYATGGFTIEQ